MNGQDRFCELMLRYRGLLFSVCRRYRCDGMEIDDLLQETTLALWALREQLFSITIAPKQAAWVWRVARNTCIDLQRSQHLPERLPEGYDIPAEDTSQHQALQEMIAQLSEPDRTIVRMHLEGFDYKEIGKKTGFSKSNVGVRLTRIKEKLKEQWNNV